MKMDVSSAEERRPYYAGAASWARDQSSARDASKRIAWVIAAGALCIAGLEAAALAALMPLRTIVPYVVTVDRQTGYVDTSQALRPGELSQNAAVIQAFLAQYVMARETFDVADLQQAYREVAAWTAGQAREEYVASMQRTNPQSPLVTNQAGTIVQIQVKSISLLSATTALVRFDADRGDAAGPDSRQAFAAIVGFRFAGQPMRMEDRFHNPLGFQVTSYRRDAETPVPIPVTPPGSAAPGAAP